MRKPEDDSLIRVDLWQCGSETLFVAWCRGRVCYVSSSPDEIGTYLSRAYGGGLSRAHAMELAANDGTSCAQREATL
jgi:hypothetical protein